MCAQVVSGTLLEDITAILTTSDITAEGVCIKFSRPNFIIVHKPCICRLFLMICT